MKSRCLFKLSFTWNPLPQKSLNTHTARKKALHASHAIDNDPDLSSQEQIFTEIAPGSDKNQDSDINPQVYRISGDAGIYPFPTVYFPLHHRCSGSLKEQRCMRTSS